MPHHITMSTCDALPLLNPLVHTLSLSLFVLPAYCSTAPRLATELRATDEVFIIASSWDLPE